MSTWILSNLEKKNCVEREFWKHPDFEEPIVRETGWRWGTFSCESDEKPNIDLANPDGFWVYDSEYDFELINMDDGCWEEITWPQGMSDEESERLEELWNEDGYDGWESEGITNDDTEVVLYGELDLNQE